MTKDEDNKYTYQDNIRDYSYATLFSRQEYEALNDVTVGSIEY